MNGWTFIKEHRLLSGLVGSTIVASATVISVVISQGGGSGDSREHPAMISASPSSTSTVTSQFEPPVPSSMSPPASAEGGTPVSSNVMGLESGDIITDSLDFPGETDGWTFQGASGDFIEIRVDRDPTGSVRPSITVVDPFGQRVEHDASHNDYAQLEYWLESTGEFAVEVRAFNGDGRGPYKLRFQKNPFKPIEPESVVTDELSGPGEKKRYSFNAQAGQVIRIRADRDPTGNVRPSIELMDPFGDIEKHASNNQDYAELETTLRDTGRFVIIVKDFSRTGLGRYTLGLTVR